MVKSTQRVGLLLVLIASVGIAICNAQKSLTSPHNAIDAVFFSLDLDGSATLSLDELNRFIMRYQHVKPTQHALDIVMSEFDMDLDGEIHHDEFITRLAAFLPAVDPIKLTPEQIHLAVTNNPTEMRVMWVSWSQASSPTVQYQSATSGVQSASAVVSTYSAGIFGWSGLIYNAVMTNLQPNTKYTYRVGDASTNVWSFEYSFSTERQTDRPFVFAVYGDMGTIQLLGFKVFEMMFQDYQTTPFDMMVHVGDVAYAGTGSTWEFESLWDLFFWQIQPLATLAPYMVSVGNHEHYYNYTSFLHRFDFSSAQSGGYSNFWYSYDFGHVHWTMFSTEHPYTPGSPQYQWIEQDLAKAVANRQNVPWIAVTGHRPFYCSDADEYSSHRPGAPLLQNLEPLFMKYGVDLVFTGHQHMYERIFPVFNGTVDSSAVKDKHTYLNPRTPTYIVQGTAGAVIKEEFVQPAPTWSAFRDQQYGYGRMTVYNSTHIYYEYRSMNTYGNADYLWLIKN